MKKTDINKTRENVSSIDLRNFLESVEGDDSKLEKLRNLPSSTLIKIMNSYNKQENEDDKRYTCINNFLECKLSDVDLKTLKMIRQILSSYSIKYLNFFLVDIENCNGITKLRDYVKFRKFHHKSSLSQTEEEEFIEVLFALKSCLRNVFGFEQVILDKDLLSNLFKLLIRLKNIKIRIIILQIFSLLIILNEKDGVTLFLSSLNISITNLGVLLDFINSIKKNLKKTQYLLSSFTFLNSLIFSINKKRNEKTKNFQICLLRSFLNGGLLKILKKIRTQKSLKKHKNLQTQVNLLEMEINRVMKLNPEQIMNSILQKINVSTKKNEKRICKNLFSNLLFDLNQSWANSKDYSQFKQRLIYYNFLIENKFDNSTKNVDPQFVTIELTNKCLQQQKQIQELKDEIKMLKKNPGKRGSKNTGKDSYQSNVEDSDQEFDQVEKKKDLGNFENFFDDEEEEETETIDSENDIICVEGEAPLPPSLDNLNGSENDELKQKFSELNEVFENKTTINNRYLTMQEISDLNSSIFFKKEVTKQAHTMFSLNLRNRLTMFFNDRNLKSLPPHILKQAVAAKKKKTKKLSLITEKNSHLTELCLKTISFKMSDLQKLILQFNEKKLGGSNIIKLSKTLDLLSDSEIKSIKGYKGKEGDLDISSRFFFTMFRTAHQIRKIFHCWKLKCEYEHNSKNISPFLKDYIYCVNVLKNSKTFQQFLQYCLLIANMLSKKKAIYSFTFRSLDKLATFKVGGEKSLLEFLIFFLKDNDPTVLQWKNNIREKIENLAGLNIDLIEDDLQFIKKEITNLTKVLSIKTDIKNLSNAMVPFLRKMKSDHSKFMDNFKKAQKNLNELASLFGETSTYIKTEFFTALKDFIQKIEDLEEDYRKSKSVKRNREYRKHKTELLYNDDGFQNKINHRQSMRVIDLKAIESKIDNGEFFRLGTNLQSAIPKNDSKKLTPPKKEQKKASVVTINKI